MERTRQYQYTTSGSQLNAGYRYGVADQVELPQSARTDDREVFRSDSGKPAQHVPATVSTQTFFKILVVLFVVLAVFCGVRAAKIISQNTKISKLRQDIAAIQNRNIELEQDVLKARDRSRISSEAEKLKMVYGANVTSIEVYASETRPAQQTEPGPVIGVSSAGL